MFDSERIGPLEVFNKTRFKASLGEGTTKTAPKSTWAYKSV